MTLEFILKSFTIPNIATACELIQGTFEGYTVSKARFPTKIQKFTVLSSPHGHKKSREQFEIRTHKMKLSVKGFRQDQLNQILYRMKNLELLGVQMQVKVIDSSPTYVASSRV
jgi:ribosomal protein S10